MGIKNTHIGIIILLLLSYSLMAQNSSQLFFKSISKDNGLVNSTVRSIFQDRRGFVWFCTEGGLCRYDGYRFKTYSHDPDDSTSISNNVVRCMAQIDENRYWIGTRDGLSLFDASTEEFVNYNMKKDSDVVYNWIHAITSDRQGGFWIGTYSGIYRIVADMDKISWINDSNRTKYVYTNNGLHFIHYNMDNSLGDGLNDNSVRDLETDRDGNLWIGTDDGGLISGALHQLKPGKNGDYPPDFEILYKYLDAPKKNIGRFIQNLFVDDQNVIWIATFSDGLYRYNPETGKLSHFFAADTYKNHLTSNAIFEVKQDPEGNLWSATFNGLFSLNVADLYSEQPDFIAYPNSKSQKNGLSSDQLLSLLVDNRGELWIGTYGSGINFTKPHLPFEHINQIPGNINSPGGNSVFAFFEDRDGELFIGYSNGKFDTYNPATNLYKHYDLHIPYEIRTFYQKNDGGVLIGTRGNGFYLMDKQKQTIENIMSEIEIKERKEPLIVTAFYETEDGRIMVGSDYPGLFFLNQDGHIVIPFTEQILVVRSIFKDSRGNYLIARIWAPATILDSEFKVIKEIDFNYTELQACMSWAETKTGQVWGASLTASIV